MTPGSQAQGRSTAQVRALIYARVSTAHHDQKPEVQLDELRRYCAARGWTPAEEVVDHGFSGGTDKRPGLRHLLMQVRARRVDVVVVSKLDRLARSLRHLVALLDELSALDVQFVSLHDQIDMRTAGGRLMVHIVAAFAEFERALIRERTVAGLAHARAKGKRLGRPRRRNDAAILHLRAKGLSYTAISREIGCDRSAVYRALKAVAKTSPKTASQVFEKSRADER
ncbi:MAG: recombinase family protein [Bdellovibrionales bacterium]|nr:recombinase family protein [Bdellovibrionales bacterium]